MFIRESMTGKLVTIDKDAGIFEAREKMDLHRIRHLPVVGKDHQLIGIVSDRDIREALPSGPFEQFDFSKEKERLSTLKIKNIMTRDPITISPMHTLEDALLLIQEKLVGALPVVDADGRLIGILSVRDLLRAFINVLGIGEPGTLLGILVEDKIGQLKGIVDAITAEHVSFGSVLVVKHWEKNKRAVFPYLLTQNVVPVKRKLEELGYTLIDPMDWNLDRRPDNS